MVYNATSGYANVTFTFNNPGKFNLTANCSDNAGNYNDTMITEFTINDTTAPTWVEVPPNKTNELATQYSVEINATDKIAVDKKTDVPAVGNAANHAVGVARRGLKAALYTVVGDDVQGKLTDEVLEENGVVADYVVHDQENGTNFSAVINYQGERTILVYHEPRDYQLPDFQPTKWIYLTSASGDGVNQLHSQVEEYLDKNPEVKLSFNPGTHQMHLGFDELKSLLSRTDVLFLNRDESAEILGVETKDVKELLTAYHDIGVKTMVMTDGPDGAYVSDGSKIYYLGIFEGPVIERTGAGDAFGSGFMSALIKGKSIEDAMLNGNANSTSVVQFIGAREGLLSETAAQVLIDANSGIKPEVFGEF